MPRAGRGIIWTFALLNCAKKPTTKNRPHKNYVHSSLLKIVRCPTKTGFSRPLVLICFGCFALAACFFAGAVEDAGALSWQWKSVDNRERLLIYLDAPGEAKVERSDRTAVTVTLPTTPQSVTQAPGSANPAANLVAKVDSSGNTLIIGLKAPAFGYITTSPDPRQVQIDFFADPLGARWKPKPGAKTSQASETPQTEKTQAAPEPEEPKTAEKRVEQAPVVAAKPEQSAESPQRAPTPPPQGESAAQAQNAPAPEGSGQTVQGEAPPQTGANLTEKDIVDAPPPSDLDTLFNILTGDEQQNQAATPPPPAPEIESTPPAPEAAQAKASPPAVAEEPAPATPPAPAVKPAPPAPVAAQTPPAPQSVEPGPDAKAAAAGYGFTSEVNFAGPQEWDAQKGKTAPAAEDAAEPLEEVVKTPPAEEPMLSATGQLAQVQANLKPLPQAEVGAKQPEPPAPVSAAQNATAQASPPAAEQPVAEEPSIQNIAQNATAQAALPPAKAGEEKNGADKPGTTAAGQVFGSVDGSGEGEGAEGKPAGHNATAESAGAKHGEEAAKEAPPQLDADGNPIPPPPDPEKMLAHANDLLASRNYSKALEEFNAVAALPKLTDEQRESALYGISDSQYGLGQDKLAEFFPQIIDSTEKAMNFNLKSPRVPSLLLRLGFVNMKMDNVQEAEAYFNMLKRNYPDNPNIPLTYYYWGDYFFKHDDFRRASDQFQYIVQNYPDSRYVREASMGLARSLYNLGYYEQAYQVGQFIDGRWPRFYVEFPAVLTMFGDMAIRLNKLDDARRYYWTYFNIAPKGADADTSLVHLGDIYMQQGKPDAAREVYQNAVETFPKEDGGLIAEMRLAENGIHDAPLIPEMDQLFDRAYTLRPMEVYTHIIKDFPDSTLVPLATLKLAMWELWNKRYEDSLKTCEEFVAKYPKHALLPNIQEVVLAAFSRLAADSLPEANYSRVVRAWDSSPTLQSLEERLTPEVRLSLSMSKANQNKASDAISDLDPFFRGAKDPQYGDSALVLALSTLIDNQSWDQIEPLAMRVSMWELKPETKAQLDYARALAFENRGQPESAQPLWEGLKNRADLPPQLQAYTLYFLSRAALRKNDMENAYYLSRQALQSLSDIAEADPTKADTAKIKTLIGSLLDITESSGRAAEALEWYQQYAQYVRETDEEWPSLRFRLAQLYKAAGDPARWASTLNELVSKFPDTLYGKMAASELQTNKLKQNVSEFMPPSGQ